MTKSNPIRYLFPILILFAFSAASWADRNGDFEFTIQIPYLLGEEVDFEGGAAADIADDPGFGFGIGYHVSEQLAWRMNISWNTTNYDVTRVLDDGLGTEVNLSGTLDTFTLGFGGDYYLTQGKVAPFINANLGWTLVDSNIPAGPPQTVCWWDPWFGYLCSTSQATHNENVFNYGLGAGVRFDMGRNNFIRVGYFQRWLDFDEASDSPTVDTALFEFGFSY
jgi:opacity protein-like surface antigen